MKKASKKQVVLNPKKVAKVVHTKPRSAVKNQVPDVNRSEYGDRPEHKPVNG